MKKGEIILVKVEKIINHGYALGRVEGKVIFVDGCLPNEYVKAKVLKIKKDYLEARAIEILEKSPFRIEPKCKFFGFCGGCKLQNIVYNEQLKIKKVFVEEAFGRISKIVNIKVNEIIGADNEYFYRNKMEFSFAKRWLFGNESYSDEEKNFALGLHVPKQFDKVINIDECYLQSNFSNKVRNFLSDFLFSRNISIHSLKNKAGLLKALMIREAKNTEDKLVALVTTKYEENLISELSKSLKNKFPEITTFVNVISSPELSSTLPDRIINIYGKGYIIEKLFDYSFEIYPETFFQTNTKQAEKLFGFVIDYIEEKIEDSKESILVDLYSGVGVIGIILSRYFNKVFCYEEIESAVEAGQRNASLNNVNNIHFFRKDLNKGFIIDTNLPSEKVTVVIDPPRAGMSENTVNSLLRLRPQRIIYISCNPVTQARDIQKLSNFYQIELIQPVDMFPQTYHVENIVILKLFSITS